MAIKKYALEKYLTKEDVSIIEGLKEKTELIRTVTKETEPGIYNFRGCPNVAIWNIRKEQIGIDREEVLFSFCLRYFDAQEGGIYYTNSKSKQLRDKTETNNKKKKNRPGPNTYEEEKEYGAFASQEVIRKNSKIG